jgi:hypothetical protein
MFHFMPKFSVVAINSKSGIPGLMGHAETQAEAVVIQDRATKAGWLLATICDSPEQQVEFGKTAEWLKGQEPSR